MIKIRDSKGELFNEVKNPAVVADKSPRGNYIMLKIGEKEVMEEYYDTVVSNFEKMKFPQFAKDLCLIDLPKNQKIIDRIFQTTGYIDKFIREHIKEDK